MSSERLLAALDSLNRISATINRISPGIATSIGGTLSLIVESAIQVVPRTSAVIYSYDQDTGAFDPASRVSAGEEASAAADDQPRPGGMGARAIQTRRPILSYEADGMTIHPVKEAIGAQAVACFPLIVAEQAVGVLYVYLHEPRHFDELEMRMLSNFVHQAAMAIFHTRRMTRINRDLLRREEEISHLHRAGLLISSRPRLEETLDVILQMALEITDARYGIFRLVDASRHMLVTAAFAGEDLSAPLLEDLPLDAPSITTWVAQERRPLLIPDLQVEPWSKRYYPLDSAMQMRSELAVPLIGSSGRLEGVLNLESPEVGAFSRADSHLLQALATQAVVAIQEVRLLDALQEVADHLLTRPYAQVLAHLARLACNLLNAADAAIWLREGADLVLQTAVTPRGGQNRVPLAGSLLGRAIIQREPISAVDVRADPSFQHLALAEQEQWAGALVVPLLSSDAEQPIGVFSVYGAAASPARFAESAWDKKVLVTLAHYVTLAVRNEAHQQALRTADEQRMIAETFAAFGDIAANVLHQLNNKVGTIPVRVQGIEDKCAPSLAADAYLAANLAAIEKSARQAMDSVRASMTLLGPINPQPVTVAACVAAAVETLDLPDGIQLDQTGIHALPPVVIGKQGLTLIFANLFQNAASAMRDAGTIRVTGAVEAAWLTLAVSDTGPGIPPDLQGRIFEFNFSRQDARQRGKLGFGLWWVKTLVARLGGTISVASDGQRGTAFHLRLPLRGIDQAAEEAQ